MDVIQTSSKHVDKFGAGLHGFSPGNPASGLLATALSPEWCDNVQQEIVNLILGAGLSLNPASKTQVYQAVLAMISGQVMTDYKDSARFTTTGNIALSGLTTQAGGDWPTALTAGDRVLAKDQTVASENALWIAAAGAWTRASDADGTGDLTSGTVVAVEEGTANADSLWMLTTNGPITIGTTALVFERKDSGAPRAAQLASGSATVAANALTVTLDPSTTDFRSTTLTSGSRVSVTNSAALSLTVPATATLGTTAGVQARLAVLEINNAGVKELAIVNLAGGNNLDETTLITTTAISVAANSANVIYSQSARSNVAFRVRMMIDITEAVAGTWAISPSLVQAVGGQAGPIQSIGYGQTWQDMTSGRAAGTTYTNTTGKPIQVSINGSGVPDGGGKLIVNGLEVAYFQGGASNPVWTITNIIPPGATYSVTITLGVLNYWRELR